MPAQILAPNALESRPAAEVRKRESSYIRSARFDATLLVAPLGVACIAAAIAVVDPKWYAFVLLADVWLLGYHHVVATYTRLTFNRESFKQNRFLAVDLLLLVMIAAGALAWWGGTWVIVTLFLYLQWFHYMRQSYGIGRMYFRATAEGKLPGASDRVADAVIYTVPLYCIAARSSSMPSQFLELPIRPLVLPAPILTVLGAIATIAVAVWVLRAVRDMVRNELNVYYTGFMASHIVIFTLAYLIVDDANAGWVGINVWHNFQYVMVVWMVNARRFAGGVDPQVRLLSGISQPGRVIAYFATCLMISTFVYFNLNQLTSLVLGGSLAATLAVYMGINFHHYLVDAMIWRRRRPAPAAAVAA
jgi:hypothetical protein